MDNRLLWVVFFMILQNATLCPRVVMQSNFGNGNNTLHTKNGGFSFSKKIGNIFYTKLLIFSALNSLNSQFCYKKFSKVSRKILKSVTKNL